MFVQMDREPEFLIMREYRLGGDLRAMGQPLHAHEWVSLLKFEEKKKCSFAKHMPNICQYTKTNIAFNASS
jgi:hypothetical protein